MEQPVPLRDAATVVVLREHAGQGADGSGAVLHGADGSGAVSIEVLMLRRHGRSGFAADAWVFPGGVLDEADGRLDAARWTGIDPEALAPRFGWPAATVLGLHVCAVRETFEEAGLLLARHADGTAVDLDDPDIQAFRRDLADREREADFAGWLAAEDLVLDLGRLTLLSRWQTPRAEPRRYDTAFFLARAPEGQIADHDRIETTGQRWVHPQAALDEGLRLLPPTRVTLERLAEAGSIAALIRDADAGPAVQPILPHLFRDDDGRFSHVAMPWDPDYPAEAKT